jgi:hypothetical protein
MKFGTLGLRNQEEKIERKLALIAQGVNLFSLKVTSFISNVNAMIGCYGTS